MVVTRSSRSKLWHALESLESRRMLSGYVSFSGAQTITPGPTINVSNDNSFGQSGMVMDVNPRNPLQVAGIVQHVGGWNEIDLYRSNDGGTTWAKTAIDNGAAGINDGSGAGVRFDPAIAYDEYGGLYVGYSNDTGTSTSIIVGRSSDNGATFTQFRTIATTADIYNGTAAEIHGNAQVSLATGPDGFGGSAFYVTYVKSVIETGAGLDQRIMLDATNFSLSDFLGAVIVNNASVTGADSENYSPDVAVGPNGQAYVVWQHVNIDTGVDRLMFDKDLDGRFVSTSNFGTDAVAKNFANGSLVGFPISAQPEHGVYTEPTLAVDRSGGPNNGRVYLSYVDQTNAGNFNDTDVHVMRYNGTSWTDANVFASTTSEFDPQIAVDQNSGAAGVAFYSTFGTPDNASVSPRMAMSIDGGVNWTSATVGNTVSNETGGYSGDYSDHLGLGFRDGAAHVFWAARHGAGTDLDAFTATVGFVSATGGNVGGAQSEYVSDQQTNYMSIGASGNYLVVQTGTYSQEAFLASTINNAYVQGAFSSDNMIFLTSPPSGINLTVNGGYYNDSLFVYSLSAGTPVTFNGSYGNDELQLSYDANNVEVIQSPVTFNGDDGTDSMYLRDTSVTVGKLYTVGATSVTRAGFAGAMYGASTEYVLLFAGSGHDQVNIGAVAGTTTVDVNLGDGDDACYLGNGNYSVIQGIVSIVGGNGDDYVAVVDNGTAGSDHYQLTSWTFTRDGAGWSTFSQAEEFSLLGENGNNTISVNGTQVGCLYEVNGNGGSDTYDIQGTDPAAPVVIYPSAGDDAVNVNTDNTGTAKVVFPYSERIGALTVGNGGVAQLAPAEPGDTHALTVTGLSFGTGQLDLCDGSLVVDYTGATPIDSVRDALTSGYFASGWTGAGIVSSTAAAKPNHDTALGYGEAAQLGFTNFSGVRVDSTAILVKYTYYGDANLDGAVDTVDFNFLAVNFGGSGKRWTQGDFNFDTTTDTVDFNLLAACFSKTSIGATNSLVRNAPPSESLITGVLND